MRVSILILAISLITLSESGYCAKNDTNSSSDKRNENTRIYDSSGNFKGRTVGEGDNVRIYDNKGNFSGRIIQDKDGSSARVYDNKGNFKGRIVR
jgi:hypothetical protein